MAFAVGSSAVVGVVDLASGRVSHVHHGRSGAAHPEAPQAGQPWRQRLAWMTLWGRESCVVVADDQRGSDLLVLRLPESRGTWETASRLEVTGVRCVSTISNIEDMASCLTISSLDERLARKGLDLQEHVSCDLRFTLRIAIHRLTFLFLSTSKMSFFGHTLTVLLLCDANIISSWSQQHGRS